ncbi:NifB/NifX family molybdenum-iron cluster-binding protein [Aeromonas allosaccharophila]|uniref:NifB/NifX family molybdenum-iron cluster-binding protein n=1 Tax=Aeromonas allosaccharophila TaxID=656 RepID=UPI0034135816
MTIITAIPMNDDHIAGHFAKAERFVFVDEQGCTLAESANLVAGNECKSALVELFSAHGASRIVLKYIGSKMLGKLFCSGLAIAARGAVNALPVACLLYKCRGQLNPDTRLGQTSAFAGGIPSLY